MITIKTHKILTMACAFGIAATLCISTSIGAADTAPAPDKPVYFRGIQVDKPILTQNIEKITLPKAPPKVSFLPLTPSQDTTRYPFYDITSSVPSKDFTTMLQENITQQVHSRGPFAVRLALKQKAPKGRVGLLTGGLVALEKTTYTPPKED